jgi:methylated-DNA-[protein]-cysteine S-methyltransferase
MRSSPPTTYKGHYFRIVDSPIGPLWLVADEDSLVAISWEEESAHRDPQRGGTEAPQHPVLVTAARQLEEYFAGKRKSFELKLHFVGTDFQRKVWNALLTIPFGETRSYGQIAAQIGHPSAIRAVGAANGQNPIPIIAPCHRVVGSTGKLVGFGGGLPRKAHLLTLEGVLSGEMAI